MHPAEGDLIINHVMSTGWESKIFSDFLSYFREFSPSWARHVVTIEPLPNASVYHYHRPNMEERLATRSVVTVHHDLRDDEPWLAFDQFKRRYEEAAAIVCLNSVQQAQLVREGFAQTEIIPHGFNDRILRLCSGAARESDRVTLGIASRRYGRRVKGEALLFELAKRLPAEKFSFLLVGADRSKDAALLWELGHDARVYETLPYRLMQRFYEEIDALLILSWHEGGPASMPEAIATGTPIFTTRVGMGPDLIAAGRNGEFLERNPDSDAEKLRQFAENVVWRQQLRSGAQQLAGTVRPWQEIIAAYLALYQRVAAA